MRKSWTTSLIESELRAICISFGYMPSCQQMRDLGRNDLMCAITKNGGLFAWSDRVGFKRRASDSDFGWYGEEIVASILRERGHRVERSVAVKAPFDLLVDGVLRIDVKTANLATYKNRGIPCSGWYYRIGKIPGSDLVALLKADTKDIYFIPWDACPRGNITITSGGKYTQYANRFDIVQRHVESLTQLKRSA